MVEDSTSLSFLNLNWCENVENQDLIYPLVLDPLYSDYYVEVSNRLIDNIKRIDKICFTYKITVENNLRIININTKEVLLDIGISDYEKAEFIDPYSCKLYFVLNKNKMKRQVTTRNNKLYKQQIEEAKDVVLIDEYEDIKKKLFDMQISHNINFIFLEDEKDLERELKNCLKYLSADKEFYPKTKSFKKGQEQEYAEYILSKIPGISKCVSKNVSEKYGSLYNLYMQIQSGKIDELLNLMIIDDKNQKFRSLGAQQASKIVKLFTSDDPIDNFIYN